MAPPFFDDGVVSFRQLVDEFVRAGEAGDLDHLGARHCRVGQSDILMDCAVEEQVFLQYDADMTTQPGRVDLTEVGAIDQDLAFIRQVEALNQFGQS